MDRIKAVESTDARPSKRKWLLAVLIPLVIIGIALGLGTGLKLADPSYRDSRSSLPAAPGRVADGGASTKASGGEGVAAEKPTTSGPTVANNDVTTSGPTRGDTESPILPTQADKIVKTGEVAVAVGGDSIQAAFSGASGVARELGGFVSSSSTQNNGQATLTLRVPSNRFEELIDRIGKFGDVKSLSTNATDVTGQVVDLEARIRNLEAQRDQITLLMSKATTLQETMTIQDRLFTVTSQIEQLRGRLGSLNSRTEYSTLTVSLSTGAAPVVSGDGWGTSQALSRAAHAFVDTLNGFIVLMGPLGFIALLVLGIWLIIRPFLRRRKRSESNEPPAQAQAA